jgi:AcrR family transcriptional regulator
MSIVLPVSHAGHPPLAPPAAARSRRRGRNRPVDAPALDRRAILEAALGLVDAAGLEALSMRKLGALLGVEAMTLYYYIPGKAALLQGIAEVVLDQLEVPDPPTEDWRPAVRALARSFRRLGFEHPNVFPVLATVGLDNPASYRPTEAILQALAQAGFSPPLAFTAFSTIKSYVVGHVLWILGDHLVGRDQRLPSPETIPSERFPWVASYLPYIVACDADAEFERGLHVLLAGLDALHAADHRASGAPLD